MTGGGDFSAGVGVWSWMSSCFIFCDGELLMILTLRRENQRSLSPAGSGRRQFAARQQLSYGVAARGLVWPGSKSCLANSRR